MNLSNEYVRRKIILPLRETLAEVIPSSREQRQIASEVFDRTGLIEFEGNASNVWYNILDHANKLQMMDELLHHSLVRYYLERNPNLIYCELLWLVSKTELSLDRLYQIYEVNIIAASVEKVAIIQFEDIADILAHIWKSHGKVSAMQFTNYLIEEIKTQQAELSQKLKNWVSNAQTKLKTEINLENGIEINQQKRIESFTPPLTLQSVNQAQEQSVLTKEKPSNQQDYDPKIDDWLKQFGFDHNPFTYSNSEYNTRLSEYFVEHDDFENTIGFNHRFIFARPGDGKTAIRLRLQAYYRDALHEHHAFAFSYLIPEGIIITPPSTMNGHYKCLLTAAVCHAFVLFVLRGMEFPLENQIVKNLVAPQLESLAPLLVTFFNEYYPAAHDWQKDLQQMIESRSLRQVFQNLNPLYDNLESVTTIETLNLQWLRAWLKALATAATNPLPSLPPDSRMQWLEFCGLMEKLGVQRTIVLVDGVNSKLPEQSVAETIQHDHIEQMQAIIKPILGTLEQPLWKQVSWKFFLPLELYLPLTDPEILDDNKCVLIEWDSRRLKALLQSRLYTASNSAVTSLNQLTAKDVMINLDNYLCVASGASPRHLIRTIYKMFSFHVNNAKGVPGKISHASLSKMR